MSSYGSIFLPKNVFKNVLPTIGSFTFKMAATRIVQKVKMRHISVTSDHMKTNNGSTSRLSGTRNTLVALFLSFKVEVTAWLNVIGPCQPPASENMPYLSDFS